MKRRWQVLVLSAMIVGVSVVFLIVLAIAVVVVMVYTAFYLLLALRCVAEVFFPKPSDGLLAEARMHADFCGDFQGNYIPPLIRERRYK